MSRLRLAPLLFPVLIWACSGSDASSPPPGSGGSTGSGGSAAEDGGLGCKGPADCPSGEYCDASGQCLKGCDEKSDCAAPTEHCDPQTKKCVACTQDAHCGAGKVCDQGACVEGCSASSPCQKADESCCAGKCQNLNTDSAHCGACGKACSALPNAQTGCVAGTCGLASCNPGFADCDQNPLNGCEHDENKDGPCTCKPGATQPCYFGPTGTENIGPCKGGTQTCDASGKSWGACVGQTTPVDEVCANNVDDNCNGKVDDVPDVDGDGWTKCDGDCCEDVFNCSKPKNVNPGAFEFVGNGVDDDCDPTTSDTAAPTDCSTTAKFSSVKPEDVAKAMELCQFATPSPPLAKKKWGVVSAQFRRANGSTPSATELNNMQNWQSAVMTNYGTGGVVPQVGKTLAGLSSGKMRDQNDPGYVNPNAGTNFSSTSQPPALYLAAHSGSLPASQGCSGSCPAGSGANDSVNVRLQIRVPTNALSFKYQFRFFSSEYWVYQCTKYNDFYLALLTSGAAGLPADKNISFDALNNPVSVNNGFFDFCAAKGCNTCPLGTSALGGTGMQLSNTGGGTTWLTTTAPVVPGETITLEFMVFDVSDNVLDSLVLLDGFQWSIDPSQVGTDPS